MTDPKREAENQIKEIPEEKKEDILQSYNQFQDYLKSKIEKGEALGLNEHQIAKGAERVAEYLKRHEEPRNTEEKLLQEMWKVADEDEKHAMGHILVKLAKEHGDS
ncbi:DUF3243 family protein [Salsuginibacillus kocurii]|uniref:DUF3243 family protein n=1 Tax=Salsuginibacillus kocurii TaxID=427078 RepID=UPI00037616FC|nr:DUF3243 family protein [Salsuginibacillus kocurii]